MTTLAEGQVVEQGENGRLWRLTAPAPDGWGGTRWSMVLVRPIHGDANNGRTEGHTSSASETWLQDECHDYVEPRIDPPQGDGRQTMVLMSGTQPRDHRTFTTVEEMLTWTTDQIGEDVGFWYGWEHDPSSDEPACLSVTLRDGELTWAEV